MRAPLGRAHELFALHTINELRQDDELRCSADHLRAPYTVGREISRIDGAPVHTAMSPAFE